MNVEKCQYQPAFGAVPGKINRKAIKDLEILTGAKLLDPIDDFNLNELPKLANILTTVSYGVSEKGNIVLTYVREFIPKSRIERLLGGILKVKEYAFILPNDFSQIRTVLGPKVEEAEKKCLGSIKVSQFNDAPNYDAVVALQKEERTA